MKQFHGFKSALRQVVLVDRSLLAVMWIQLLDPLLAQPCIPGKIESFKDLCKVDRTFDELLKNNEKVQLG